MPRTSPLLSLLVNLPLCLPAQEATTLPHGIAEPSAGGSSSKSLKQEQAHVAKAMHAWVAGFSAGRFQAKHELRKTAHAARYLTEARRAGILIDGDTTTLTHLDILQRMMFFAEQHATDALADALLEVACIGLKDRLYDRVAFELREMGHWALMRIEDQGCWFVILRAAAGERVPLLEDLRPEQRSKQKVTDGSARRVAALRLIGQRDLPVFRSTLEAAFFAKDPRLRLAAIEAVHPNYRLQTMERVVARLKWERHPVVSQALAQLLLKMLHRPPKRLTKERKLEMVDESVAQVGRFGWRTDMDLLDIVKAFPRKQAIPHLIRVLEHQHKQPDQLVKIVNKGASKRLRMRTGALLRAMTGTLLTYDDPASWRFFWAVEQDKVVVPAELPRTTPGGTRSTFFGMPVTGTSVAFLIDTSGSMVEPPADRGPITGPRGRSRRLTRLGAAKEQLALATQSMEKASQYYILTFAETARVWTPRPIRPSERTKRSLTQLMSRLNAAGGTNLFDGLVTALEMNGRGFGQQAQVEIDELFVLSDGLPTAGAVKAPAALLEMVRQANHYAKVRINCVFTGTGKGKELLRQLAEQNHGVFVQR